MATFLCLLLLQQLQTAGAPVAPLNSIATGIVIVDGVVNPQGRLSDVRVIYGMPGFIQPSLEAIKDWTFAPAQDSPRVSVTFLYRPRNVFSDGPFEVHLPNLGAAFPSHIVDPGYPLQSIAEGSVILQAHTNARGVVEGIDVIRPVPSLTESGVQAVRRWTFTSGAAGTAIVVMSFLRPVLYPS